MPRQVVCLSVCLSVTFRYADHTDWNTSKIISRLIGLKFWLGLTPYIGDLVERQHPKNSGGIGVGPVSEEKTCNRAYL